MKIINLSDSNSIINKYLSEVRDPHYQKNKTLFRNNIERIGQLMAYEISKTLLFEKKQINTPLGIATISLPVDDIVLATILRAGLPFHSGFLKTFDHAENAFVSAFREYSNKEHTEVNIHVEYLACPKLEDKTLIVVDPMLATGGSMELGYKALLTKGKPKCLHFSCILAAPQGIKLLEETFPQDDVTLWCAAIDSGLNPQKYIIPGFGDAGDLCFGEKL